MLSRSRQSIDRLVHYHRSMPIETDEVFDRLTQAYVNELEKDQVIFCQTLIQAFDRHLVRDHRDAIDHIHWRRLQSDLYLQLSHVSRPYQSRLFYNVHRKLFEENEQIIAMDRDRHIDHH